jgi:hypothetical protein
MRGGGKGIAELRGITKFKEKLLQKKNNKL